MTSRYENEQSEWDEEWTRIREMQPGVHDLLPEFQQEINDMMENLGNEVGRPLMMKVQVQVYDGELKRPEETEVADIDE